MKNALVVLMVFLGWVSATWAEEPPADPILRIEAGAHTASIHGISTDSAGRLALTVSVDKTARLWELPSGRLLRVLRPPIGEGIEGQLFCGALSPDGAFAAVGGATGYQWGQADWIYLFDTATGAMVRRLGSFPDAIKSVAFSTDGKLLAATLGVGGGFRVLDPFTGKEVGRDGAYRGASSYSVDWSGSDRLVTASDDGYLRLYRLNHGKIMLAKERLLKKGANAFQARFSPDGHRVAIGFDESPTVMVVDGNDLSFLFSPDTTGVSGDLATVGWSDDGSVLAAAGTWGPKNASSIRRWPDFGRGRPWDTDVSSNSINGLRSLTGGRFLFVSVEPSLGFVSPTGPREILVSSPVADYRHGERFLLSGDGTTVAFAFDEAGLFPAQFSLLDKQIIQPLKGGNSTRLHASRWEGLNITDWNNKPKPKLAGAQLALEADGSNLEESRSLAISSDASTFLLGAEWSLRSFTKKGKERWNIEAPAVVWAVNLADKDRLAVAAYGDGTIRWHRADNGKELLAFFPLADRKRWVLWTPQGYYDCSPGAEDLIGWHVNRGKDQAADFFPAAKFRDQFYRPDVIQQVLSKGDVTAALRAANEAAGRKSQPTVTATEAVTQKQPPVVELAMGGPLATVTESTEAQSLAVRYRVRQGGAEPVSRVRVQVNGRPVDVAAPIPSGEKDEASVTVPLPPGECTVSILAENKYATSQPAILRVARLAAARPTPVPALLKPKLYILAVGVADLKMNDAFDANHDGRTTPEELIAGDPAGTVAFADLNYADADARDVATVFKAQEGGLYGKVETRVLTNKDATATAIRDGLDWIKAQTTARDLAVVFFSGHGENDNEGRFYFLGYDYDQKRRKSTGVSFTEIEETVKDPAGKMIFFIDACHAGNALGKLLAAKGALLDINRLVNELSSAENGAIVFASSTGRQESLESLELRHGVFAQAIIEAIKGKGDVLGKGSINLSGLEAYVCDRVKDFTQGQQTPTVAKPQTMPDFPIALKK